MMWGKWGAIAILTVGVRVHAMGLLPFSKQVVPNLDAVLSWQEIPGYRNSVVDPLSAERISVQCADTTLYPTHPQQSAKLYHLFLSARYDQNRLKAGDEACAMASKYPDSRGRKLCLRPDYLEYAVISDTYRDSCGNMYRGFWDVAFLKTNDNMGVLFAKGRTLFPKPGSEFANDMYIGDTYAVDAGDFLFLSPLLEGDEALIRRSESEAERTHRQEKNLYYSRETF